MLRGQGHPHEFRETARFHLVHDVGAMNLYCSRTDPKLIGYDLVWAPFEQTSENFTLSLGQNSRASP